MNPVEGQCINDLITIIPSLRSQDLASKTTSEENKIDVGITSETINFHVQPTDTKQLKTGNKSNNYS